MPDQLAGITVPDTKLIADTTAYIRDVHDDLLYDSMILAAGGSG